jgi:predicted transcriptional regulator
MAADLKALESSKLAALHMDEPQEMLEDADTKEIMSTLTIELPESLKKTIEELAAREGYSVSQFLASAAGEKLAIVMTMDYLRREAAAGRREDFEKYLAAVPDALPSPAMSCERRRDVRRCSTNRFHPNHNRKPNLFRAFDPGGRLGLGH